MSSLAEFELVMFGPNITGYANVGWQWDAVALSGGSLSLAEDTSVTHDVGYANGPDTMRRVSLDASEVSSLYGPSLTVQPASVRLFPCLKT